MNSLKSWLHQTVQKMRRQKIKSITGNYHYLNAYNTVHAI